MCDKLNFAQNESTRRGLEPSCFHERRAGPQSPTSVAYGLMLQVLPTAPLLPAWLMGAQVLSGDAFATCVLKAQDTNTVLFRANAEAGTAVLML